MSQVRIVGWGYEQLPLGLLPYLTKEQIKDIYYYNKKTQEWLVPGKSVINCFEFHSQTHSDERSNCVCGVYILNFFYVRNICPRDSNPVSYEEPLIGSECIENWIHYYGELKGYKRCSFCGRKNKSNYDCKNCSRKQMYKEKIGLNLITKWKEEKHRQKQIRLNCISNWKEFIEEKRQLVRKIALTWILKIRYKPAQSPKFPFGRNHDLTVAYVWKTKPADVVWFYNNICMNIQPNSKYEQALTNMKRYVKAKYIQKIK